MPAFGHRQRQPPESVGDRNARQRKTVRSTEDVNFVGSSLPIDFSICQQEFPWERLPVEGEVEPLSHEAVGAVAANEIVGGEHPRRPQFVANGHRDHVTVVDEVDELGTGFDDTPEFLHPTEQQFLCQLLWQLQLDA